MERALRGIELDKVAVANQPEGTADRGQPGGSDPSSGYRNRLQDRSFTRQGRITSSTGRRRRNA